MNARIKGKKASDVIGDTAWFENEFTPKVATRGGALIKKWGRSSAASTAVSVADAIRALVTPTKAGDCFSSGVVPTSNPYGVPEGLNFSFPLRSDGDGSWELVRPSRHPPFDPGLARLPARPHAYGRTVQYRGLLAACAVERKGGGAAQVEDFEINDWLRTKIDASVEELSKERDCVGHLIPGSSFAACNIKEDTMLPGEN